MDRPRNAYAGNGSGWAAAAGRRIAAILGGPERAAIFPPGFFSQEIA